jgi:cellulose synthase/poly-beta-1,6-N-acetylglucosamine synthase-like glycosyltransferase
MIEHVLQVIMSASLLTVFLFYSSYFVVLYHFYRKKENNDKPLESYYPTVSLITPTYNEEKIIRKKIQNIEELDYPKEKIEVIFVDGCSTDQTAEIIQDCIERSGKFTRLIRESRRGGYNTGISEGILDSKGEIIVVTDTGAYHHPDALKHLVKHFKDDKVGAVTGKEIVLSGHKKELGPKLEAVYRNFYDFMRIAETRMDSTPDSKGEILAIRRDVCMHLLARVQLSPNASFDSCVPYQAKLDGYRTIYEPRATYYEYAPSTIMDRMKQQVRRASVLIGSMLMFKNLFMNKKYNKLGLVIIPAHFIMLLILPWLILSGSVCLLILTIMNPIWLILWAIILTALLISKSRLFLVSFIQSQIALMIATLKVATHRGNLFIDTIPSTRI